MDHVYSFVPVPNPITPRWLTTVLRESGCLRQGVVTSVETEPTRGLTPHTKRLRLHYWAGANPESPARVILKQNYPQPRGQTLGKSEVEFYQLAAEFPEHPPGVVPCYAVAYDQRSGNSYLLLHDLSHTHRPAAIRGLPSATTKGVPSVMEMTAIVDALAEIHAYWWDHPVLETGRFEQGYAMRNAAGDVLPYFSALGAAWASLNSEEQAWFPHDLRDLYAHVLACLPGHWHTHLRPRYRTNRNLTLIQNELSLWNVLRPRDGKTGPTYLLDWHSPGVDIWAYDLVNLCAAYWTPQRRYEGVWEIAMLDRYYILLRTCGVTNYTWAQFTIDYATAIIYRLFTPLLDRYQGASKDDWWPNMQCTAAAFRHWHCHTLLGF